MFFFRLQVVTLCCKTLIHHCIHGKGKQFLRLPLFSRSAALTINNSNTPDSHLISLFHSLYPRLKLFCCTLYEKEKKQYLSCSDSNYLAALTILERTVAVSQN